MTDKITLTQIQSGYELSKINDNFQKIEDELNDKVLYRNPPANTTNTLEKTLDANNQKIVNLPVPTENYQAVPKKYVDDAVFSSAGIIQDTFMFRENNLSDISNPASARANLGLGNVDNTSDANKPVSTATQTALDLKLDKSNALSFENKVINGNFIVNQRNYVSGTATVAGQYIFDRWKVTGTSGVTFSTTDNKTTVTIPGGQTLQQVIEGINLQTGNYTLLWEGTAKGRIAGGSYGSSGSVSASITGGSNTTVEFSSGKVANVQLKIGNIDSPFNPRPYSVEEALCKRYYQVIPSNNLVWSGYALVGNVYYSDILISQMRAAPTVVNTSVTNGSMYATTVTAVSPTQIRAQAYAADTSSCSIMYAGANLSAEL